MLDLVDTRLERIPVVVVADRDRLLQHDRAGIHALVDQVHGHSCHLGAVCEGVAHAVHPREGRQERGVDVQPSVPEASHDLGTEEPEVAGADHGIDPVIGQRGGDLAREGVAVSGRLDHRHVHLGGARALERLDAGAIAQDERDVGPDRRVIEQRLQVRTPAGDEDREATTHAAACYPRPRRAGPGPGARPRLRWRLVPTGRVAP